MYRTRTNMSMTHHLRPKGGFVTSRCHFGKRESELQSRHLKSLFWTIETGETRRQVWKSKSVHHPYKTDRRDIYIVVLYLFYARDENSNIRTLPLPFYLMYILVKFCPTFIQDSITLPSWLRHTLLQPGCLQKRTH